MRLLIRREMPDDRLVAEEVTEAAFAAPGSDVPPVEVAILRDLRACDAFVPELSLVAEADGVVVGHVICTRGQLGTERAVGLGPISVAPDRQRQGIGSALIHAVVAASDAMGEAVVVVLGDPAYYSRFGFGPADALAVDAPDPTWGDYFQARPLQAWTPAPRRSFTYAAPLRDA